MISTNIDLGQMIITGAIAIIGWFIKNEFSRLNTRLDKHDSIITSLTGQVQRLIGYYTGLSAGRSNLDIPSPSLLDSK